jgi:hypothetical protein
MPLNLDGTPVQVVPPSVPVFTAPPPSPPQLTVVPVQGPQGIQGPPGVDVGAEGGFVQVVSSPTSEVQVIHGLIFKPAGIICQESDGTIVEYAAVSYPVSGVVEIMFGFPFSGTVFLS